MNVESYSDNPVSNQLRFRTEIHSVQALRDRFNVIKETTSLKELILLKTLIQTIEASFSIIGLSNEIGSIETWQNSTRITRPSRYDSETRSWWIAFSGGLNSGINSIQDNQS